MSKKNNSSESPADLIIDRFFDYLETHSEFDHRILSKLEILASRGDLTKSKSIEEVIDPKAENKNENN